jgi:hypothetical protein
LVGAVKIVPTIDGQYNCALRAKPHRLDGYGIPVVSGNDDADQRAVLRSRVAHDVAERYAVAASLRENALNFSYDDHSVYSSSYYGDPDPATNTANTVNGDTYEISVAPTTARTHDLSLSTSLAVLPNLKLGWANTKRFGISTISSKTRRSSPRIRPSISTISRSRRCANVCFGGRMRNRLVMACGHGLYALYVNIQGTAGG